MKIFIICGVRGARDEYKNRLEKYVAELEARGNRVHLPHRDTDQLQSGINICRQNMSAIKESDEVHVFYTEASQGTHFDLGVAFAFGKRIKVIENVKYGEGKSYPRMIDEWESENN